MLTGLPPFYNDNLATLYQNIQRGVLEFPEEISPEAVDLIQVLFMSEIIVFKEIFSKKLLNKDPNSRLGVKNKNEIKEHPFFDGLDWEELVRKEISPPYLINVEDKIFEPGSNKSVRLNRNFSNLIIKFFKYFTDRSYSDEESKINRVRDFSFERENI